MITPSVAVPIAASGIRCAYDILLHHKQSHVHDGERPKFAAHHDSCISPYPGIHKKITCITSIESVCEMPNSILKGYQFNAETVREGRED